MPAKPSHQLVAYLKVNLPQESHGPILKHAGPQSKTLLPCPASECHHISDHVVSKIHGKKRSHGSSPYLKHFCTILVGKPTTLRTLQMVVNTFSNYLVDCGAKCACSGDLRQWWLPMLAGPGLTFCSVLNLLTPCSGIKVHSRANWRTCALSFSCW